MKIALCIAFLGLACTVTVSHAAEATDSPALKACMDKSGDTTAGMINCTSDETGRQDKRLNAAYQELVHMLPATRVQKLRAAERLWLQYRHANCDFYVYRDGGTGALLSEAGCILDMTKQRAAELESMVQMYKM